MKEMKLDREKERNKNRLNEKRKLEKEFEEKLEWWSWKETDKVRGLENEDAYTEMTKRWEQEKQATLKRMRKQAIEIELEADDDFDEEFVLNWYKFSKDQVDDDILLKKKMAEIYAKKEERRMNLQKEWRNDDELRRIEISQTIQPPNMYDIMPIDEWESGEGIEKMKAELPNMGENAPFKNMEKLYLDNIQIDHEAIKKQEWENIQKAKDTIKVKELNRQEIIKMSNEFVANTSFNPISDFTHTFDEQGNYIKQATKILKVDYMDRKLNIKPTEINNQRLVTFEIKDGDTVVDGQSFDGNNPFNNDDKTTVRSYSLCDEDIAAWKNSKRAKMDEIMNRIAGADIKHPEPFKKPVLYNAQQPRVVYQNEPVKQLNKRNPQNRNYRTGVRNSNRNSLNPNTQADLGRIALKNQMQLVPRKKKEIFEYVIDWQTVDDFDIIDNKMRKWINKKSIELFGEEASVFIGLVLSKLRVKEEPEQLIEKQESVLEDESVKFVVDLWRALIFETIKVKNLNRPVESNLKPNQNLDFE